MIAASPKVYRVELDKPHQEYRTADGSLLPGCSTIAGLWPKGDALIAWAAKEEREATLKALHDALAARVEPDGLEADIRVRLAGDRAHKRILARAASVGTIAHTMCEAYVNGGTFDATGLEAGMVESATGGYNRFREWWDGEKYVLVSSERQFVCERYGFGGTIDLLAKAPNGETHLLDLKTSKAIYDNHKVQVGGGYRIGCEDGLGVHVSKVKIVRIGKDDGDFNPRKDVLDMGMAQQAWAGRAFLACLGLWRELKAN